MTIIKFYIHYGYANRYGFFSYVFFLTKYFYILPYPITQEESLNFISDVRMKNYQSYDNNIKHSYNNRWLNNKISKIRLYQISRCLAMLLKLPLLRGELPRYQ